MGLRQEYEHIDHEHICGFNLFLVNLLYRTPHMHSDYELLFVLDGTLTVTLSDRTFSVAAGHFTIINSYRMHEISTEDYALILAVQILPSLFRSYYPQITNMSFSITSSEFAVSPQNGELIFAAAVELAHIYFQKKPGFELQCMALINVIFSQIIQHIPYRNLGDEEISRQRTQSQRIQRITDYIQEHYQQKLLLSDIAAMENLSLSYLSHAFIEWFHMPFQEYLMLVRCEKARQLLLLTNQTLLDISVECGFSDLRYLKKAFLKQYKCTPSDYRKGFVSADLRKQQWSLLTTQDFLSDRSSLVTLDRYDSSAQEILLQNNYGFLPD
jgi:AraC-like DNA-binding protein